MSLSSSVFKRLAARRNDNPDLLVACQLLIEGLRSSERHTLWVRFRRT